MFIESQISVIQRNLGVGVDHINDWLKPGIQRCLDFNPSFSTRGVGDPGSRSRSTSWSKGLYYKSDALVVI